VICEPIWFVIATVRAPSERASCGTRARGHPAS
jgi:hypothetical protein